LQEKLPKNKSILQVHWRLFWTHQELIKTWRNGEKSSLSFLCLNAGQDYLALCYELHSSVLYCKNRCVTLLPQYLCHKNSCISLCIVKWKRDWEIADLKCCVYWLTNLTKKFLSTLVISLWSYEWIKCLHTTYILISLYFILQSCVFPHFSLSSA
jgi:hypothetical protein